MAARLPDDLYDRFQALAVRTTGERFVFYTGWGSTETAPTSTGTYWDTERVGLIGLPFPGVELKMVPAGAQYELRLRGVNVTPGYYGQPELTQKAFDEEGFYCIGDAGVFVNPDDPAQGLIFSGRVVEDFKLTTGTFVLVGSPHRCDCGGIAGHSGRAGGRAGSSVHRVAGLAEPRRARRRLIGDMDASLETVVNHPKVRAHLRDGLLAHNKAVNGVSSMTIARAMLMASRRLSTATNSPTRVTSTSARALSAALRWSSSFMQISQGRTSSFSDSFTFTA
jgi:feruloyl-CoA synthase